MNSPFQFREAQRDAFCRGCDVKIKKGEHMVTTYSWRNRGQHIHFCVACAEDIGEMVKDFSSNYSSEVTPEMNNSNNSKQP